MKEPIFNATARPDIAELEQKARETKNGALHLRFALRTGHLTDFSEGSEPSAVRTLRFRTAISEKRMVGSNMSSIFLSGTATGVETPHR